MHDERLPSVPEILSNTASSPWLRSCLQAALFGGRDASDTAREARLLADVLTARAEAPCDSTGFAYYDGVRPDVDVLLPLLDAQAFVRESPRASAAGFRA